MSKEKLEDRVLLVEARVNEMAMEETYEFQRNYILHHLSLLMLNSCIFDFEAFLKTKDKFEMWCFDFLSPVDLLDL
jgi:hypothetical protein